MLLDPLPDVRLFGLPNQFHPLTYQSYENSWRLWSMLSWRNLLFFPCTFTVSPSHMILILSKQFISLTPSYYFSTSRLNNHSRNLITTWLINHDRLTDFQLRSWASGVSSVVPTTLTCFFSEFIQVHSFYKLDSH